MMRGSDSTTAKSSVRPPMVAGPILRNFRFLWTSSYFGWAKAVAPSRRRDRASFDGMGLLDGLLFYTTGGSRVDAIDVAAIRKAWRPTIPSREVGDSGLT